MFQLLRIAAAGLTRHVVPGSDLRAGRRQQAHRPGLRIDRLWKSATAALAPAKPAAEPVAPPASDPAGRGARRDENENELSPPSGYDPGRYPREGGHGGNPVLREDTFLVRVREVARLRNPDATVAVVDSGGGVPAYLRVTVVRPGLLVEQRPVGVCEPGATPQPPMTCVSRGPAHIPGGGCRRSDFLLADCS